MRFFSMLYWILALFISVNATASEYDSVNRLQTLFTTPSERAQLDRLRHSGKYSSGSTVSSGLNIRPPLTVTMQGVMIHGNKVPVAFINDQSTLKTNQLEDSIRVNAAKVSTDNPSVRVRVKNNPLKMKPGQQWREDKPQVREKFQIKPEKAKTSGLTQDIISTILK